MHVGMQRMIQWALHVCQEDTLDRHIEAVVETKVVCLLESVNHEVVFRGAVNEVIYMEVDNLAYL